MGRIRSALGWLEVGELRAHPRRTAALFLGALLLVSAAFEGIQWFEFYHHANAARATLRAVERDLDLGSLDDTPAEVEAMRARIVGARGYLEAAQRHVDRDPLLAVARRVPGLRGQAAGLTHLIRAARASGEASEQALDVLLAYTNYERDSRTAVLRSGVAFLRGQETPMAEVRASLDRAEAEQAAIPPRLPGPIGGANADLSRALDRLDDLVTGYERATALLPALLGFDRPRTYLLLAQNNTELFPSGGLISNYGLATFENGELRDLQFEYFITLFDRWQRESRNEYIEPPGPLKQYLLRNVSWALGEAGWYPDFPTTAALAQSFVAKGGAEPTDGTIAIDLAFVRTLLEVLGPVSLPEYGLEVTADNVDELTLEQTRNELAFPDSVGKAFLSVLANRLVERMIAAPKARWLDLIEALDTLGRERHLQLHFSDPALEALAVEYGFAGDLVRPPGDFLMLADTSVSSTKLNLILRNSIEARVYLDGEAAEATVAYTTTNPFPEWQQGRDPRLVRALMLGGTYGSYLRLYAPVQAQLIDLRVDSRSVGAQQIGSELGKQVFARFTPVLPGATNTVEFRYKSEGVLEDLEGGWLRYRLYVQKQPGTDAIPLALDLDVAPGFEVRSITLDGAKASAHIATDLSVDRTVEVVLRTKR